MNYIISAKTDVGLTKRTNQDSLSVKTINTSQGRMVFAILCDGMGGLEKGEVASATLVKAFDSWVMNTLPVLCDTGIDEAVLRVQWSGIIAEQNELIKRYGMTQGIKLGTTIVVMLITQSYYYVMNVGDSRAYEISDYVRQLTNDHTFVAREVALGNMTLEQARRDKRRSVLLQCVGASPEVYPEMYYGVTQPDIVFMLCSDGFYHEVSEEEILGKFWPGFLYDYNTMEQHSGELIELVKERRERDNISVVLIRTF